MLNYEHTFDLELSDVGVNHLYKCLFHEGCEGVQPGLPREGQRKCHGGFPEENRML